MTNCPLRKKQMEARHSLPARPRRQQQLGVTILGNIRK